MVAVDHRFALSMPALVSAPDKKSFSRASWPILACSSFRSTGGGDDDSAPNTLAARSSNWFFQSLIWLGCTSCNLANSARVFSPRTASRATLALKIDEWLRRGLLLMVLLLSRASSPIGWCRVSTYRRVLISEATSNDRDHNGHCGPGHQVSLRHD